MNNRFPNRFVLTDNSLAITVFIMGIQIHNRYNIFARNFVKRSMSSILHEIDFKNPDGYLAHEYINKGKTSLLILYWSDYDKLISYARNKALEHFPAWVAFNSEISAMDSIGLWHEIYHLPPGSYSGVYKNCFPSGMGKFLLAEQYQRFFIGKSV